MKRAMKELDKYGKGVNNHVTEVYSPPRVTNMVKLMKLIPVVAFDLTQMDDDDGMP